MKKFFGRRFTERTADTRTGHEPGGRTYFTPFARVWDALLRDIEGRKGWTLVYADEELGILTVTCRSPVLRLVDDLTIWVGLDDNGLTRVEARSSSRTGWTGANRRRLADLIERLDRALGSEARVRTEGDTGPSA
ncbi:MAG: DUF1499 domain-containing protein [Gemmatimonadota bacterium]